MQRKIISLSAAAAIFVLLALVIPAPETCRWDFRNNLWGPAHLLVNGQSPYAIHQLFGDFRAVWFPQVIGAFFYLGWLECGTAANMWILLSTAGLLALPWLLNDGRPPRPWAVFGALLGMFLYPSLYTHYSLGQISILFSLMMVLAAAWPPARAYAPLLLAVGLAKPQLIILVYPGIFLREMVEYGLPGLRRLALRFTALALLLTLPLFIAWPGWLGDFLRVSSSNLDGINWIQPSLFLRLMREWGGAGIGMWVVILLAALGANTWLWLRVPRPAALAFSLALTTLVSPYIWSWDFVLLFPALAWLINHLKGWPARAVLGLGVLANYAVQVSMRWQRGLGDAQLWWVPVAMMAAFLAAAAIDRLSIPSKGTFGLFRDKGKVEGPHGQSPHP